MSFRHLLFSIVASLLLWLPLLGQTPDGQSAPDQDGQADPGDTHGYRRWNIHLQATSVVDHHGSFYSAYEGENSLPALHVARSWTVTADYQPIQNPAYNKERGPLSVLSLRLH